MLIVPIEPEDEVIRCVTCADERMKYGYEHEMSERFECLKLKQSQLRE